MTAPCVSVVIPCHNVGNWVRSAVQSAVSQGALVKEIIAVDNNSSDNTRAVLDELSREYPLQVTEEKAPGACAARNKGLSMAQGDWIQFLDADDILLHGKIAGQWQRGQSGCNIAGAFERVSATGVRTVVHPLEDVWKGLFSTRLGITSSLLLRTADVRAAGGWDSSLKSSQEYDLMFRMLSRGARFMPDGAVLTRIRERSGQISAGDPEARWQRYLNLRLAIMQYLAEHRSDYYRLHVGWYRQALFDLVRTVYPHAPAVAVNVARQHLGPSFRPAASEVTGKLYLALHAVAGFPAADRIIRRLRRK